MKTTRRQFLQRLAATGLATPNLLGALAALASRPAAAATGDYKALVCIFQLGGNDSFNMVIPRSNAEYNEYAAARQTLAIAQADLLPINPLVGDGADYGLHPAMPEAQVLFEAGELAIAANVGALVVPTSRADYLSGAVPLPPNLFSHNSQQNFWQSVEAFEAQNVGWAGRMAELMAPLHGGGVLPINCSLSGANLLQVGTQSSAFNVNASGAPNISGFGSANRKAAVEAMYAATGTANGHFFQTAFAETMERSFGLSDALRVALETVPAPTTVFAADGLSQNLRMVAHIIASREQLGMQRQVFFVGFGGWDTHDDQLPRHVDLLGTVSRALAAFQAEMTLIGCNDNVTTFTASDFGRTLTSNGDGSDHGWGSHHLVLGGAVNGQRIHGQMPTMVIDGPQDSGRGRIIPDISVDQYGAAMARWFGVAETDLDALFPNLANFAVRDLGLLAPA